MVNVGQGLCEVLEWDTTFFGFRVARVCGDALTQEQVQEIDDWCGQNRVRCLYFLSRADDADTTRLAEDHGFRLVDIRMTFERWASGTVEITKEQPDADVVVRHALQEDVALLQRVARDSYHDTRFHFDTNFPRHLDELLYETWIKVSCEGYADAVLVAILDGVPVGYITCHIGKDPRSGRIGLVGIGAQVRGRGVGRVLVFNALDWFCSQGVTDVLVVTQGRNCAAQRLYQGCGFLTREVQLWYHKWYPHSAAT